MTALICQGAEYSRLSKIENSVVNAAQLVYNKNGCSSHSEFPQHLDRISLTLRGGELRTNIPGQRQIIPPRLH